MQFICRTYILLKTGNFFSIFSKLTILFKTDSKIYTVPDKKRQAATPAAYPKKSHKAAASIFGIKSLISSFSLVGCDSFLNMFI